MKDLTTGSIPRHILQLALPMTAGMLFQTMYYLVDLYFVAQLGDATVAGVSSAGNVQFVVMALTQILGVGTTSLIAQAVGRKDREDANAVFNQSLLLAAGCTVLVLVGGLLLSGAYMRVVAADAATVTAGTSYLMAYVPGLALQFPLVAMGSALRGTGIVKPTMLVQMLTVAVNIVLAPVLIAGVGTGRPLGAAGAGLASSIAIALSVVLIAIYFVRLEHYVAFSSALMRIRTALLRRMLAIGVPPGIEFALMFTSTGLTYYVIRQFGAASQAGYGIGSRVLQAILMPAMAVAFSTAPLAGQNYGAGRMERVRDTFKWAVIIGGVPMALITVLAQIQPALAIGVFTNEAAVVSVGADFLRLISFNFVATGLIFTCSGMFQALGNTMPSLISSATRLITYAGPV
ncbi:MAG: MATE family efflux transporter, partial [Gemmatimonadaceae bacterium]|nr:MATE family efflux transporter [Gemmatimonadaceae bacterium]